MEISIVLTSAPYFSTYTYFLMEFQNILMIAQCAIDFATS